MKAIRDILLGDGPVAIDPGAFDAMCLLAEDPGRLAAFKAHGDRVIEAARANTNRGGGVAVVPVYGAISEKSSIWQAMFGGTSTEDLSAILSKVAGDKSISCVVLDVHSPGGTVAGVPELADQFATLGATKNTIAVANSEAASAAYWIASQAKKLCMTQSGDVGSIGVYAMHADYSKALEASGVKVTYVYSGKNKIEGNPTEPLSDDARAFMQSRVDDIADAFVKAVATGRGVSQAKVKSDFGQGRVYGSSDALSRGMVDQIASLDQVLSKLGADKASMVRQQQMAAAAAALVAAG